MSTRRVVATIALVASAGCSSMQAVPVKFISDVHPPVIHLADGFGVVRTVEQPRLSGDTVVGIAHGEPVAVPLREVQRVSTVRFSGARTMALVAGMATAGAVMAYVLISKAAGPEEFICQEDNSSEDNGLCDINR